MTRPAWLNHPAVQVGGRILLVALIFYSISAYYVRAYYAKNVPHFDSIGSLTRMYDLINRASRENFGEVWSTATTDCSSRLQLIFAALGSPVLPKTPEAMMVLNFVTLIVGQGCLYYLGRQFGAGRRQALAFGLLPLLPVSLFGHYGTYQDMRRDGSFLGLLLAVYALSLVYARQPTLGRGLALGAVAGITQWARLNALPYTVIVLLPAAAVIGARCLKLKPRLKAVALIATPIVPFLWFSGRYFLECTDNIIEKYVFGAADLYHSRSASLAFYSASPITMILGRPGPLFSLKVALVLGSLLALAFLAGPGRELTWQPWQAWAGPRRWLWLGGIWIIVSVIGMLTIALGTSPTAGHEPVYPALIGVFSLIMAASFAFRWKEGRLPNSLKRTAVLIGLWLLVLGSAVDELRLATYQNTEAVRQTAQELLPLFRGLAAEDLKITWLWDGNLNYWVVNYYLTQAGEPPFTSYLGSGDLETPPNLLRGETQESRLAAIKQTMLSTDVLILSDTPEAYAGTRLGTGFFIKYGYLIVPEVLADPRFEQIYSYDSDGYHFVILRRQ